MGSTQPVTQQTINDYYTARDGIIAKEKNPPANKLGPLFGFEKYEGIETGYMGIEFKRTVVPETDTAIEANLGYVKNSSAAPDKEQIRFGLNANGRFSEAGTAGLFKWNFGGHVQPQKSTSLGMDAGVIFGEHGEMITVQGTSGKTDHNAQYLARLGIGLDANLGYGFSVEVDINAVNRGDFHGNNRTYPEGNPKLKWRNNNVTVAVEANVDLSNPKNCGLQANCSIPF